MLFGNARPLVVAGLMLTLAGCGSLFSKSEPTRGDLMIAEGEAVADLGKMWNDGKDMVNRADSLAAEGAKLKRRGQNNIAEGRALTERSQAAIEEQQREYARFAANIGPLVTLQTAVKQREHLGRVVDKWHEGWLRLNKGRELVEKGRSRIAEGDAKIAESERLRRQGHQMMQRAERNYNSEGAVPAGMRQ